MIIRRDTFQAIADPTRREIMSMIAHQTMNLKSIAANFTISRQAVSLHIKILTECGLIIIKKQGRDRYCEARFEKLGEVSQWIEQYRTFWTSKLDALENQLLSNQEKKQLIK